jgi:glycosyltransferase involved in cell wall biosynthesis
MQASQEEARKAAPGVRVIRFEPWRMHRAIPLRFPKYLLYSGLYFFALWREAGRERPDLLFVRNAVLGLPVLLVARLRGIPCAISYTDLLSCLLGGDRRFPRPLIALLRAYEAALPGFFDARMSISPGIQEAIGGGGLTLDGADVSLFKPLAAAKRGSLRRSLGLGPKSKLVVFHGTIEAHHGQQVLPRIVEQAPELQFLIVGGGPGFEALKSALKGKRNCRVLPFQPPHEVAKLAAAADAGIVPYEPSEGLDLVYTLKLLEYFALGLPVTCFRLKSAEAVFSKSGYLFSSRDEADFAAQLRRSLRLKPSAALRGRIRKDFSWEAVTKRVAAQLEAL